MIATIEYGRRRFGGLYVLADPTQGAFLPGRLEAALRGGARLVQYRDKRREGRLEDIRRLRALCRARGVPFLVNDDPGLALRLEADGVHLGRDDTSLADAREALGPAAIIGVSCYDDVARARTAVAAGADYVAFGCFFPSHTKPEAPPCPLHVLTAARSELPVPIVAIGGITPQNGGLLLQAGAHVLAVSAGVFGATHVEDTARCYSALFSET
ncbi:MAG: thiamine phosphate synthase [Acidiferrobacteraceae bacterium]|jgi:thiamine-phosphate pyrophosphorylase